MGRAAVKILDAPNATGKAAISAHSTRIRQNAASRRCAKSITYCKLALIVGRLIPLKGIEQILATWNTLPTAIKDEWKLVFIITAHWMNHQRTSPDHIELAGRVPAESMPYWYAAADLPELRRRLGPSGQRSQHLRHTHSVF